MSDDIKGTDTPGQQGVPGQPTDAELAAMSREELVELGGKLDGVETVYKDAALARSRHQGREALRTRGGVLASAWRPFGPGAAGDLLVLAVGVQGRRDRRTLLVRPRHTAVRADVRHVDPGIGIGAVLYQKKFIPEEISIQDRHDGSSPEIHRKTIAANLTDTLEDSTLKRRKLIGLSLGVGLGAFGLGTLVAFAGGLIKNPWKPVVQTAEGKKAVLWTTGWTPRFKGETIYVARATGNGTYVKMRPEDIDAGGMETVFPWRESDGDGTTVESHHKLSEITMGVRNPVMLIRIKAQDLPRVVKRKGQESFNFGDLFAFTKVCSHLGCPSSLYEQQTYRILCPCHQSQFDALHFAKPIFGPAARALAQLPITIDQDGYLVANGDFIEPVGPAFWERKS